jgi:TusA-related sulfurtransferase
MEIDLTDIVWPVCVIQCNEALTRLEPGDDLAITVSDPDVVHNIVLLIKSRPDLQFDQQRESRSFRICVHRLTANQKTTAGSVQTKTYEKA